MSTAKTVAGKYLAVKEGRMHETPGGLTSKDIGTGYKRKAVSKARQQLVKNKRNEPGLAMWTAACEQARKDMGLPHVPVPIRKNTDFYSQARMRYNQMKAYRG